ncbi:MFS transporter [Catenuloplanes atrovinosus]|uniref:MFS family permease n=1 Tax=Catenuloplanes atrovinosus TaxID=137266 RepID=A0AAE3YM57_9ACTN|nr:MFS transporter [Catenuloplanes atrovinosus]MDR7274734.1 MFS family permease [Catenuloplanes atrovinosus]
MTKFPDHLALSGLRPLFWSTAVSMVGQGAFATAAPLLVASITSDPLLVSLATVAIYVPWLLIGLPAGTLVDRSPRRAVMIIADLVRVLVIAAIAGAIAADQVSIWPVLAVIFLATSAQSFFDSASQATIPALLGTDEERLNEANGRFWTLDNVGRAFLGPLIGAMIFAWSRVGPFLFTALSFLVSALFVARLPAMGRPAQPTDRFVAALRGGIAHFRANRDLRLVSVVGAFYNFCFNVAAATLVLYADREFGLGPAGYGFVVAAMAVGAMAGGLGLSRRLGGVPTMAVIAGTLSLQGIAWLVIGAVPVLAVALAAAVLIGLASVLITVTSSGLIQRSVPDAMMGRATSVFRIFVIGFAGLGALAGGLIADAEGLRAGYFVAGGLLVPAGLALAVVPVLKKRH